MGDFLLVVIRRIGIFQIPGRPAPEGGKPDVDHVQIAFDFHHGRMNHAIAKKLIIYPAAAAGIDHAGDPVGQAYDVRVDADGGPAVKT